MLRVTLGVKIKGQITYFLVNASAPKMIDEATSNFVSEWVIYDVECISCGPGSRSKVK